MVDFPKVPGELFRFSGPEFLPAPQLGEWARHTFIEEGSPLWNIDHQHLALARILWVWAARPCRLNNQDGVVGTAEVFRPMETKWSQRRSTELIRGWAGGIDPQFIVTICGKYVEEADPNSVCALIEHELYHCGQEKDAFGFPKYDSDGLPKFAMRGHDVEEFVGVVARYGAYDRKLQLMKAAMNAEPSVSAKKSTNAVCGCGAKV